MSNERVMSICDANNLAIGESLTMDLVKELDGVRSVKITRGYDLPKPKEPIGVKKFILENVDSFSRFVQKYGDAEKTLILYSDTKITALLDATQKENYDGQHDRAIMKISIHPVFALWFDMFNTAWTHQTMLRFFMNNIDDIDNGFELVESWQKVKTTMGLELHTELDDQFYKNFAFRSKTESKTEHGKLMCKFSITIPVLPETEEKTFVINIDIHEPENANETASFALRSRDMEFAILQSVDEAVGKLRKDLKDFTILRGTFGGKYETAAEAWKDGRKNVMAVEPRKDNIRR